MTTLMKSMTWTEISLAESLIGDLGQTVHKTDLKGQKTSIYNPYFSQECSYDPVGNLISHITDGTEQHYSYDGLSQLSSENNAGRFLTYAHDSLYNRTQKNGELHEINDLNELLSIGTNCCSYDLNGNQVLKQTPSETSHFIYDPLDRLIEVSSEKKKVHFVYDALGRRLSKVVYAPTSNGRKETDRENYLYHSQNEIGAFTSQDELKNLRVLGLAKHKNNPATIAIELGNQVFSPVLDVQGNIRCLIDLGSRALACRTDFTAFGEELQETKESSFNPWRFASKRCDPELGLIYFGKRYYDPLFARWLTTDPAGFTDSVNLYQYVLNNPFRYQDPQGENLVGFLCGIGQILAGGALLATGTVLEVATLGGFTIGFAFQAELGLAVMANGCAQAVHQSRDISFNGRMWKNTDVYVPDRPLPNNANAVHPPDVDAPHTQLGTKEGRHGKYPQAREFDEKGNPVRDIDFTDHERPKNHPNPHQHEHIPNPAGGTPSEIL